MVLKDLSSNFDSATHSLGNMSRLFNLSKASRYNLWEISVVAIKI